MWYNMRSQKKEEKMKDDNSIKATGIVTKILNGSMFKVKLIEYEHEILAMQSGKMRQFSIRLTLGDKVEVQMSPYDLTKGRITYRLKN